MLLLPAHPNDLEVQLRLLSTRWWGVAVIAGPLLVCRRQTLADGSGQRHAGRMPPEATVGYAKTCRFCRWDHTHVAT